MKILISSVFILGLLTLGLAWLCPGLYKGLPYAGLLVVLASYLLLLTFLYYRKVDVYARMGLVKFAEKPWGYRLYFFILFLFWLWPSLFCLSRIFGID